MLDRRNNVQNWCQQGDVVKTINSLMAQAIVLQDDYALQELVSEFALSGNLLAM